MHSPGNEVDRTRETSAELLIDVTSTLNGEDVRHVLRPEEICQLPDRLMTEYHRTQFLVCPVTADQPGEASTPDDCKP